MVHNNLWIKQFRWFFQIHWQLARHIQLSLDIIYCFRWAWLHRLYELVKTPWSTDRDNERHCKQLILWNIENIYETVPLIVMDSLNAHMVNCFYEKSVELSLELSSGHSETLVWIAWCEVTPFRLARHCSGISILFWWELDSIGKFYPLPQ